MPLQPPTATTHAHPHPSDPPPSPDLCAVQNTKLDRFHVKQAMAQASEDLRAGRVIASMALERQAAALKDAVAGPLRRAADLLKKDIREADEDADAQGCEFFGGLVLGGWFGGVFWGVQSFGWGVGGWEGGVQYRYWSLHYLCLDPII